MSTSTSDFITSSADHKQESSSPPLSYDMTRAPLVDVSDTDQPDPPLFTGPSIRRSNQVKSQPIAQLSSLPASFGRPTVRHRVLSPIPMPQFAVPPPSALAVLPPPSPVAPPPALAPVPVSTSSLPQSIPTMPAAPTPALDLPRPSSPPSTANPSLTDNTLADPLNKDALVAMLTTLANN